LLRRLEATQKKAKEKKINNGTATTPKSKTVRSLYYIGAYKPRMIRHILTVNVWGSACMEVNLKDAYGQLSRGW